MERALPWLDLAITHLFVVLCGVVYWKQPDAVTASTVAAAVAAYVGSFKLIPLLQQKLGADAANAQLDRNHEAQQAAAQRDHEAALATVSADSANLQKHVQALSEQVAKLATPERLEAIKRMSGQNLNPAPRIPTRL